MDRNLSGMSKLGGGWVENNHFVSTSVDGKIFASVDRKMKQCLAIHHIIVSEVFRQSVEVEVATDIRLDRQTIKVRRVSGNNRE